MAKRSSGTKKPAAGGSNEVLALVQDFYKYMMDQRLETLELDHQGLHVRLVRQRPATVPVAVPVPVMAGGAAAPVSAAAAPASVSGAPAGAVTIKAPMMGIFYRASTPSSPPFVKNGESVKKGHVLCLIEAMKVFNEVKADFDCTVLSTLLENGKPVKAGQDIFVIQR
ncbi:MAG: acetyl-CoA carboxylase, biotin carboxyl carrier protein [Elusimicrobia bacterium]|nr:acetyl-CoA carboxylase, biotin carboxyl carrier protein [Elusimicrobiota bacterium]